MIKSKYLINIGLPHTLNLFLTKSHIYTISAKNSKIKLSILKLSILKTTQIPPHPYDAWKERIKRIKSQKRKKKRESASIFQEIMAKNFPDYA